MNQFLEEEDFASIVEGSYDEWLETQPMEDEPKQYKKLLATYGTLRVGCGNWDWFLNGCSTHLGTIKTKPEFTMYSLGGFPAVAEGGTTAITVDIFGVDDQDVIDNVDSLEGYSGVRGLASNWYDTVDIETPFGNAEMYIQNKQHITNNRVITNGDWVKREYGQ